MDSQHDLTNAPTVIIESPYRGNKYANIDMNIAYAQHCMHDCLMRGEAPFASHLLYTQPHVLDDRVAEERERGITAGFAWGNKADKTAVYLDLIFDEWTHYKGIVRGVARAQDLNRPVDLRRLSDDVLETIDAGILDHKRPFGDVAGELFEALKQYREDPSHWNSF